MQRDAPLLVVVAPILGVVADPRAARDAVRAEADVEAHPRRAATRAAVADAATEPAGYFFLSDFSEIGASPEAASAA